MFMGAMLVGSSLAGVVMSNTSLLTAYILSVLVLTVGLIPGIKIKFDSSKDNVEAPNPADQELSRALE